MRLPAARRRNIRATCRIWNGWPLRNATSRSCVRMTGAYRTLLESAVQHYRTVLDRADEEKLLAKARHGIVLALHYLGRNPEAKTYAGSEQDERKRDELLALCLEGGEKRALCQKLAGSMRCSNF